MAQNPIGRDYQRPSKIMTSEKMARSMIQKFIKSYKDPNRLKEIFPSFKERVKVIGNSEEVEIRPRYLDEDYFKKNKLVKYYRMECNKMMAFFDKNSKPLDAEKIEIFYEVSSMLTNQKLKTISYIWVFEKNGEE